MDREANEAPENSSTPKRGFNFWMVFVSGLMVEILSALDLSAVSTALPTIIGTLDGTDFIWAGSAYTIASTAAIPFIGDLASTFGRKPVLIAFILCFALGSALCGAAQNMKLFIAGRAIQGFGGGGCLASVQIINADMIPLPERGKFQGITACMWAIACSAGPLIGGALANAGAWRWIFFLNLPFCGASLLLTMMFLKVRKPTSTVSEKVAEMDFLGIGILVGSTVSFLLAMTWGGLRFPWSSYHVLAPLVVGAIGIMAFFAIEAFWLKRPTLPRFVFSSRTTLSGYLGTFFHGIASIAVIYYIPVYFQAAHGASAIGSGVDMLPIVVLIPISAVVTGVSTQLLHRYRPQNYVGWAMMLVGFGVLSTLTENSSRAAYVGLQVPVAIGIGLLWSSTVFAILAPLPFSNSAHALAFFIFTRQFAQSWGMTIAGAIVQNVLSSQLPQAFLDTLPAGAEVAYGAVPSISGIADEGLRNEVRKAYAHATRLVWQVMLGFSGAGMLSTLLMREEKMKKSLDDRWGLKERAERVALEAGNGHDTSYDKAGSETVQDKRKDWRVEVETSVARLGRAGVPEDAI
ncbi:iron permease [Polyporus arcularius HHB13444]|uniref:Iron permease n=1 Tax=Polyporus arcularius HHB13444 TaxID=1314778 RepID=A0A5C3PUQ3_9APHY|nr:iron permease [Polyporus arcularius HHB13444]